MELLHEVQQFVDEKNNVHTYARYYVLVNGVKVYLKPIDSTAKALIDSTIKED